MLKRQKYYGYIRYMMSYLLVLMLPVIILLSVIYSQTMSTLRSEIMKNSANNLNRAREELDSQFNEFKAISFQISMMQEMRPFRFLEDPLRGVQAKTVLGKYKVVSQSIYDMLFYVRSDDYMFSTNTSIHLSRMGDSVFAYAGIDKDTLLIDIAGRNQWAIYPMDKVTLSGGNEERLLTYIFPLAATRSTTHSATYSSVYGSLCFFVAEGYFNELSNNIAPAYDSALLLFDEGGRLLYATDTAIGAAVLAAELPDLEDGMPKPWKLANEDVFVTMVASNATGIRLVSLVLANQMFDQLNRLETLLFLCVAVILILGGTLIYWFVHTNYSPLNRLLERVGAFSQPAKQRRDINALYDAFEYLEEQNQDLLNRMQNDSGTKLTDVLTCLLRNEYVSEDEFFKQSGAVGLSFLGSIYGAIVIMGPGSQFQPFLADYIERNESTRFHLYALYHIDIDNCVLLFAQADSGSAAIKRRIMEMHASLAAVCESPVTIGIGRYYHSPLDIPDAYSDACAALDYRFVTGTGGVISHSDTLPSLYSSFNYPHDQLARFQMALRQKDGGQACIILDEILAALKNSSPALLTARGLCFQIIQIAAVATGGGAGAGGGGGTGSGAGGGSDGGPAIVEPPIDISASACETVDDLFDFMRGYCRKLVPAGGADAKMLADVMDYIKQNACLMSFSIEIAAARYNMSVSRFSHFFKTRCGCNFIDYVTRVKIEQAKLLMVNADTPLAEIAAAIGYASLSSFIRRFKQVTGITPGEYMHQLLKNK